MYEEAEKWMRAVGRRKFMGGSAPNLADLPCRIRHYVESMQMLCHKAMQNLC